MDPLERHLNSSQDFICFSEEVMPKVRLEQKKQELTGWRGHSGGSKEGTTNRKTETGESMAQCKK